MLVIDWLRTLSRREQKVAAVAMIAAVCGALAAIPVPSPWRAVPLLIFLLVGPGSAVMCWVDLPPAPTIAATVGISLAAFMAVAVAMAWLQFWHPVPGCLLIAAIVAASGLSRLRTSPGSLAEASRSW